MARPPSENRVKAKEIWLNNTGIKLKDIAKELNLSESQIRKWKSIDKWENELSNVTVSNSNVTELNSNVTELNSNVTVKNENDKLMKKKILTPEEEEKLNSTKTRKPRRKIPNNARPGNQNAKGNKGGPGGPLRNKHAEKHGLYSKYLPSDTMDLVEFLEEKDLIEITWENIKLLYAAILRSQKIMYVKHKEEMIKELKKQKTSENETGTIEELEYEFQFAWDRQATFLNATSRATSELRNLINQYENLINSEMATEEQRLRLQKLKLEINKFENDTGDKPININIIRKSRKQEEA